MEQNTPIISPELLAFVRQKPNWFIRFGNLIILLLLLSLLVGSSTTQNPEIVQAPLKISVSDVSETVTFANKSKIQAVITFKRDMYSKIKEGQKVLLKLDKYPSVKFGYLSTTIGAFSLPARVNDPLVVNIDIDDKLKTNLGTSLKLEDGMQGIAQVTSERGTIRGLILKSISQVLR